MQTGLLIPKILKTIPIKSTLRTYFVPSYENLNLCFRRINYLNLNFPPECVIIRHRHRMVTLKHRYFDKNIKNDGKHRLAMQQSFLTSLTETENSVVKYPLATSLEE